MSMRYLALASDYDGTLAHDGAVDEATLSALERLVQSGRKVILVTGREMRELEQVMPRLDVFARVVAENGAILYDPATHEKRALASRPSAQFIEELGRRGVSDLSVGEVILAAWRPHEREVLQAMTDFGLDLKVIFNKESFMVLPSGVNKMTGLRAALAELGISPRHVVAVGDAENDHALFEFCQCSVAVANSIPSLLEQADFVTKGERGAGVVELIDHLIADNLIGLDASRKRRI